MSIDHSAESQDLLLRAAGGDHGAFEALLLAHRAKLRAVVRRMIGHPEDTDDVVQKATTAAWEAIASFRGESSFSTWLCSIGIRKAVGHLRRQKRWRTEAQVAYANECYHSPALRTEVFSVLSNPAFTYEADEHIAYCFTCVGRSLPLQEQAALVMREVLGMSNREAAKALGLSESVLRHHLTSARRTMEQGFDGLCSLVNKQGVCYQCKGLRDAAPAQRQDKEIPVISNFEQRLQVVCQANIDAGRSQPMHDLFRRGTRECEEQGRASTSPESDCGSAATQGLDTARSGPAN